MKEEMPDFDSMTRPELISTCKTLWTMIQKLEERIEKLERRLKRTSRNSSIPPSLDSPFSHSSGKSKKPKKKGPPFGHPGTTRFNFETIDEILDLEPGPCICGQSLEAVESQLKSSQQVAELFQPVKVTEYRQYQKQCPGCGQLNTVLWPQSIIPKQSIGPNLQAWLCYLHTYCNLSYQKLEVIAKELLGLPLSQGTLSRLLRQASEALTPSYVQLQKAVQKSPDNNCDETGWKLAGIRHWLWCATNKSYSFYWIDRHRSRAALAKGLGVNYQGACHSDFLPVYDNQVGQGCLAHLQRDLKGCSDSAYQADRDFAIELSIHLKVLWDLWREHDRGKLSVQSFQFIGEEIQKRIFHWESQLPSELPELSRRLRNRLLKYWDKIFYFVAHPEVSPDNNIAERAIRPFVTNRKVSGGNRSQWGMEMKSKVFSIVDTCRKQGKDAIHFIKDALRASVHPAMTYPLLFEGG